MSREVHVRFCERRGVRLPPATLLVILVDGYRRHDWLLDALNRRVREELAKLGIPVNERKSRVVNLECEETFTFLGFDFRWVRSHRGIWRAALYSDVPQAQRATGEASGSISTTSITARGTIHPRGSISSSLDGSTFSASGMPDGTSTSSGTGSRRKCGVTWCGQGSGQVSAGKGGVRTNSTGCSDCTATTRSGTAGPSRKHFQRDRTHKS